MVICRFKIRGRLTDFGREAAEAVKWRAYRDSHRDNSQVWRLTSGIVHEPMPQAGGKIVRKGLDFARNRASLVPLRDAKGSPGIPPRRLHRLCGASVVAAQKAASTQHGIPTMSLKKLPSNNPRRTD